MNGRRKNDRSNRVRRSASRLPGKTVSRGALRSTARFLEKNCYVRDAWFAEKRKAEELEKKARGAESPVRRTKTVSLPLPLHPAQPVDEQPWCHEIVNPLPPVNCIEYIPPAASASGAGGGTTINVHAPAAAEADPFDSVYDNYKSPTASRFGRVIGRAIKQKAERDRRKAEHKRLLSTLDRREGRTGAPKTRSAHQAAVGAAVAPHKTLAPSGTVQPPPFYSAAEQARVKEIVKERRAKIEMQKKQWAEQTKAYQRAKAAKPKSYAVKPTDYSRGGSRSGKRVNTKCPAYIYGPNRVANSEGVCVRR